MPFPLNETTRGLIERHFKKKKLVWGEDYFLGMLANSTQKHDVYFSVIALRDCGTSRAIPPLKEKLSFPMQDVQSTALLTIAHIARAEETPLYAATLLNPAYKQKGFALWAIRDAADERAVDAVLEYLSKNMGKIKSGKLTNATLPDGLEYLQKFSGSDPRIPVLFSQIRECWPKLAEGERKEIQKRVAFFA